MMEQQGIRANLKGLKVYEQKDVREQKPVIKKNLLRETEIRNDPTVQAELPIVHPIVDEDKIAGLRFVCPCGHNATVLFEPEMAAESNQKAIEGQKQSSV